MSVELYARRGASNRSREKWSIVAMLYTHSHKISIAINICLILLLRQYSQREYLLKQQFSKTQAVISSAVIKSDDNLFNDTVKTKNLDIKTEGTNVLRYHQSSSSTEETITKSSPIASTSVTSSSSSSAEKDFYSIADSTGTDKVMAVRNLPRCMEEVEHCVHPKSANPRCRPWGHFYHTIYQRWLGPLSLPDTKPFQFLEIGFHAGNGFKAFEQMMPNADGHSIEYDCDDLVQDWGEYGNATLENDRLHCGDASDYAFVTRIWSEKMRQNTSSDDAPPLKLVVDDGSHYAPEMIKTFLFWFPLLAPRGLLIVEDVQPIDLANDFRTQFLPQIMADLHYCGGEEFPDVACVPQVRPFLAGVHCEMHICVFERNDEPAATEPRRERNRVIDEKLMNAQSCGALRLRSDEE